MKAYVKPYFSFLNLTTEEKFANGSPSGCTRKGSCDNVAEYEALMRRLTGNPTWSVNLNA